MNKNKWKKQRKQNQQADINTVNISFEKVVNKNNPDCCRIFNCCFWHILSIFSAFNSNGVYAPFWPNYIYFLIAEILLFEIIAFWIFFFSSYNSIQSFAIPQYSFLITITPRHPRLKISYNNSIYVWHTIDTDSSTSFGIIDNLSKSR